MEFLKKNALKFLEEAKETFNRGDYNPTIEQFFQLALKYLLYKRYGEFPKTHSLKMLFELTKDSDLMDYYKANLDLFRDIELAYIASRYLDIEYSEKVATSALNLAKDFAERLLL